jgi:hypothetical protein
MHIWADILIRELVMLVTLFALGSGPAAFLGRRFDAAARVAMAPVLGLCLGTCVFTTLIWFTAARNTYWLLPVLALASVATALWRGLGSIKIDHDEEAQHSRVILLTQKPFLLARRLSPFDTVALVLVCVAVATPLSYTLHERHSVGPVGFDVWDAVDYTAEIDAMQQQSIRQATTPYSVAVLNAFDGGKQKSIHPGPEQDNFIRLFWTFYASGDQNLDAAPLSANLNELIGLHATDTQSLFLIIFLVAGALGAFATIRYFAPKPTWTAPFAGVLFAGPFFLQLMADGSQAATCGVAVILPITAVGADVLRSKRWSGLAILALLASGLMAIYPIFVPAVAISCAAILAIIGVMAWWRGRLNYRRLLATSCAVSLVVVLSILFNLVSFLRDLRYWKGVLNGSYYLSGLPQYHLPYSVLPGWLLQTREFYFLTELGSTSIGQIILGVVLPVIFISVIVFGLKYRRTGLLLALLALIYAVMAWYTSSSHGCSYCTDRALLPIAPLGIGLLTLGVAALATAPRLWLRWVGIAVAVIAVVAVATRTRQERIRFANGAYSLDSGSRALLSHLPPHPGTVDIEGYGEDPGKAPGEFPLTYYMVSERNHGEVSTPSEYTDYSSLAYLGEANPRNPQFDPSYHYVLTRIGGVESDRRVIARTGPLALEERTGSLDATLVTGVAVPPVRLDANGLAWVEGPLHIIVVGGSSAPAWVSLRFQATVPVIVAPQPGVTARTHPHGIITACVRATGTAPLRKATIGLSFTGIPGLIPPEPFAEQEPPEGVQLVAMRAVTRCSPGV